MFILIFVRFEAQSFDETSPIASKNIVGNEVQVRNCAEVVKTEAIPPILRRRTACNISRSDIAISDNKLGPRVAIKHRDGSEGRENGVGQHIGRLSDSAIIPTIQGPYILFTKSVVVQWWRPVPGTGVN